uniref:Uncharacterized protein n=1 Tax=Anguilla anguilla TaxID=7936 RepID=A0A0E9ULI5_ANGAN
MSFTILLPVNWECLDGVVAQWVRNWACNRKVVGSIPG